MNSKVLLVVPVLASGIGLSALAASGQRPGPAVVHGLEAMPTSHAVVQDTAAGRAIFTGKGVCYACHGPDAKGTPLAPDLTDTTWLHIDGSLDAIVELVTKGVATPKNAPAPMPPKGGAALTEDEVRAVASYVFSLSHPKN